MLKTKFSEGGLGCLVEELGLQSKSKLSLRLSEGERVSVPDSCNVKAPSTELYPYLWHNHVTAYTVKQRLYRLVTSTNQPECRRR